MSKTECVVGTVINVSHKRIDVLTAKGYIFGVDLIDKQFARLKGKYAPGDLVSLKLLAGKSRSDEKVVDVFDNYEDCMDPKVVNL